MTFILSAFLLGLFGSAHCVLMCGGIASTLSGGLVRIGKKARPMQSALGYNAGRVAAYVACGAAVASLGRVVELVPHLGVALRLGAGAMLVAAGLWVAGAWNRFALVERIGAPLWRRVQPIASMLLERRASFLVGALWGLMPCGLVYAAFGLALASGAPSRGALVMAAFGLGTAPAMIATGLASVRIATIMRAHSWVRRFAGAAVLVFGLVDVASAAASLHSTTKDKPACACHHHS